MRATQVFQELLKALNGNFHAVIDDMTDQEWVARPLPGMNLPGFTLWHVARALDSAQTFDRGTPEVITQQRWASCGALATPGFGYEVTLEQADAIARGVKREDVSAYADAVWVEMLAWLDTLSDDDLDTMQVWRSRIAAYPEYNVPEILEIPEAPIWDDLLGGCGLHLRGHLVEVGIIKQQLRRAAAMPPAETAPSVAPTPVSGATPEPVGGAVSRHPARRRWPRSRK